MEAILYSDGGSRNNPGEAAIGYLIYDADMNLIYKEGKRIGIQTNNVAEYWALRDGIKKAIELKVSNLKVKMDSELIVKQLTGQYKVKNEVLKEWHKDISSMISQFEKIEFSHVFRKDNKEADKLVNDALDGNLEEVIEDIEIDKKATWSKKVSGKKVLVGLPEDIKEKILLLPGVKEEIEKLRKSGYENIFFDLT